MLTPPVRVHSLALLTLCGLTFCGLTVCGLTFAPAASASTLVGNPAPGFHFGSPSPVSIRDASFNFEEVILTRCDNDQEVTVSANPATNYLFSSGPSLPTGVDFCAVRLAEVTLSVEAHNGNTWIPIDLDLGDVELPAGEVRFAPGQNNHRLHVELHAEDRLTTTTVASAGSGVSPNGQSHAAWVAAVEEAIVITFAP